MQDPDIKRSSTPPKPSAEEPVQARANRHGNQTGLRDEIARRMDTEMLICNFDTFCKDYLPFCPAEADVESAIELLAKNCVLTQPHKINPGEGGADEVEADTDDKDELAWFDFYPKPSEMGPTEDQVFANILKIAQVLSMCKIKGRSPNFAYRKCPNNYMQSDIEGGNFKIDGCFELAQLVSKEVRTTNSAVIAEYKKDEADDLKNRKDLLSAANHIMNDDPRRSAVYGITIVDDKMSLWYFSRSHSIKTTQFSFTEEYPKMVLSLLVFIFATEDEFGYEPRILRRTHEDKWCYVYKINGRLFRTEESIFSYRSLCITGRNTRVWKAVEVNNLRELKAISGPVAIKDVWLEKGAKTEHEIQNEIFDDIKLKLQRGSILDGPLFSLLIPSLKDEVKSCLQEEAYKRHFMNIECSELGIASKEKSLEATRATGLFGELMESTPVGQSRMYKPKQHYLVVYSEVATPLDEARDLITAFRVIKGVLPALVLLYIAGWVHRDISIGNILFNETNGILCTKLSDLEYSKRFGDTTGSPDPKTGTVYFMALEIAMAESLYHEDRGSRKAAVTSAIQSLLAEGKEKQTVEDSEPEAIFYNYQHDLESLWWIALWFILCRVEHEASNDFGSQIFTDDIEPSRFRRWIFTKPRNVEIRIHPDLKPLLIHLQKVSEPFMASYQDRGRLQVGQVDLTEDFSGLHSLTWLMLTRITEVLQVLETTGKVPSLCVDRITRTKPASQSVVKDTPQKKRSTPYKEDLEESYSLPSSQKRPRHNDQLQVKRHRTRAQTKRSGLGPQ